MAWEEGLEWVVAVEVVMAWEVLRPGGREVPGLETRPGDWKCLECGNVNFSWRDKCNKCEEPKGDTPAIVAEGGENGWHNNGGMGGMMGGGYPGMMQGMMGKSG